MKIGIDIFTLNNSEPAGINTYFHNMINALQKIDNNNNYTIYCPINSSLEIFNPRWKKTENSTLLKNRNLIFRNFSLRKRLLRDKIDILWSPFPILPLLTPKKLKIVTTVHDLTWKLFPETTEIHNLLLHKLFIKKSLLRSNRIIAISKSTLKDLTNLLNQINVKNQPSLVYYGGTSARFRPLRSEEMLINLTAKFDIKRNYILFVSTIEPRKNIARILQAFKLLLNDSTYKDLQLVLVGGPGWKDSNIKSTYKKLCFESGQIKFIGYLNNQSDDLLKLYSNANLFIFPSLYEGFGLPPLEAMACGCPVVASNSSCLPEVLNDAALLVDPYDVNAICEGMHKILSDNTLREKLIQKGYERVKNYSWEKAAQETLKIFEDLYNEK